MADWEVWRKDDHGRSELVSTHGDRVEALAAVLSAEAGAPHRRGYEIVGPPAPVVVTNRDLYLRLLWLGHHLAAADRALLDYLCALWAVSAPLSVEEELDGDLLMALLTAAATFPPARPDPAWRVCDLTVTGPYQGFGDFTKVIATQVSDLLAFAEQPPGRYGSLGVDAPARLDGGRATIDLWCNLDPPGYLEAAGAGAFGGWDAADGRRVGRGVDRDPVRRLGPVGWGDVAAFCEFGQAYV
jgi:hypothetical protein